MADREAVNEKAVDTTNHRTLDRSVSGYQQHTINDNQQYHSYLHQQLGPHATMGQQPQRIPQDALIEERLQPTIVASIGFADVLCGRGKAAAAHVGNKRFREIVKEALPSYQTASDRFDKALVVRSIKRSVESTGGRFIKVGKTTGSYVELSASEAKEKIGHALRDTAVALQRKKEGTVKRPPTGVSSSFVRPNQQFHSAINHQAYSSEWQTQQQQQQQLFQLRPTGLVTAPSSFLPFAIPPASTVASGVTRTDNQGMRNIQPLSLSNTAPSVTESSAASATASSDLRLNCLIEHTRATIQQLQKSGSRAEASTVPIRYQHHPYLPGRSRLEPEQWEYLSNGNPRQLHQYQPEPQTETRARNIQGQPEHEGVMEDSSGSSRNFLSVIETALGPFLPEEDVQADPFEPYTSTDPRFGEGE